MSELRIENCAEWDDGQIVVMLDGDASEDDIAEAARRLQFAGATIRDVRWDGGTVPFDLAAPTKQFVRQLRSARAAHPVAFVLSDVPALSSASPAASPSIVPAAASSPIRCSAFLQERLTGRGLKPEVSNDGDGNWSIFAVSKALGGRPVCLRRHLEQPVHKRAFDEHDSITSWGFERVFSTWRRSAPAYDNVWRHPSGVSVHVGCRPTDEHSVARHRRLYSLAVYGLWAGPGEPPLESAQPSIDELRHAVLDGVSAWVRFGPIR